MAISADLLALERLDISLERLETSIGEARRRQVENPELDAVIEALAAAQQGEQNLAAEQRAFESDLSGLEERINRDHARMYGGQIVDPRELSSLEREIAHHRAQRDDLEERLLDVMETREKLATDISSLRSDDVRLREQWDADRAVLKMESTSVAESLATMRDERAALAASIAPTTLDLYTRLRTGTGHAVSTVSDGVCQWCRVSVPPRDVHHARIGALVTCSNCARILHAGA